MRPDGTVDHSSEQSAEVWVGTTYALAAFMIGRGLDDEGWETARGVVATSPTSAACGSGRPRRTTRDGNFRATIYLRPLAIWAIEEALRRRGSRGLRLSVPGQAGRTRSTNRPIRGERLLELLVRGRVAHAHVARRPTARTRRPGRPRRAPRAAAAR